MKIAHQHSRHLSSSTIANHRIGQTFDLFFLRASFKSLLSSFSLSLALAFGALVSESDDDDPESSSLSPSSSSSSSSSPTSSSSSSSVSTANNVVLNRSLALSVLYCGRFAIIALRIPSCLRNCLTHCSPPVSFTNPEKSVMSSATDGRSSFWYEIMRTIVARILLRISGSKLPSHSLNIGCSTVWPRPYTLLGESKPSQKLVWLLHQNSAGEVPKIRTECCRHSCPPAQLRRKRCGPLLHFDSALSGSSE